MNSHGPQFWDDVAPNYCGHVITPFAKNVVFDLERDLVRLERTWLRDGSLSRRVAVDFGCGPGNGIAQLAGRFGLVAGVDFSEGMLRESQRRLESAGLTVRRIDRGGLPCLSREIAIRRAARKALPRQIILLRANLERVQPLANSVDLAIAINSVCDPQVSRNARIFRGIAESLRKRATLLMVFPSLDTMYYLFGLFARHGKATSELGSVVKSTGVFVDSGGLSQKYWTPEEIRELLRSNSLQLREMKKVLYPWALMKQFGWGYFPHNRRLWDWYVVACRL